MIIMLQNYIDQYPMIAYMWKYLWNCFMVYLHEVKFTLGILPDPVTK